MTNCTYLSHFFARNLEIGLQQQQFAARLLVLVALVLLAQLPNNLFAADGPAADLEHPPAQIVQQSYLKASNTHATDFFGSAVAVAGDLLVIGAYEETSRGFGVNGEQRN